jgi:hypothetical protein
MQFWAARPLSCFSSARFRVGQISGKNQRLTIDRNAREPVGSLSIANVLPRGRMSLTFFHPALL